MGFLRWLFGKKEDISEKTMKHSTIGEFNTKNRLIKGGHSQKNIDELKSRKISFKILKEYSNGVRVGHVERHITKSKQKGTNQSWFPENWDDGKIKKSAQIIARHGKENDGITQSGHYGKVNVGIIRTKGKIATIFPMSVQKNKKGGELHERKKNGRTK